MPKVKWGISTDEPEDLEQYDIYDGPDIKTGVYAGNVLRLTITKNRNNEDMLKVMFQVQETGEKEKYNGATFWANQNVTEQGNRFVKAFLKALGISWSEFINRTVTEESKWSKESPTKILKIGRTKFNDGNEVPCRVQIGLGKATPEYPERRMEIKSWLPPREAEEWDDSDADEDGADDSPFK